MTGGRIKVTTRDTATGKVLSVTNNPVGSKRRGQSAKQVKDIVKKVLNRELETKICMLNIFNQQNTLGYGLNSVTGLGLTTGGSIIPAVLQNDLQNGRDGNRINPTGFYIRYSLLARQATYLGTNDNPFMPFLCRVIIYSRKDDKQSNDNREILQKGNTAIDIGSAPETWMEPYNKDGFNIHYTKQILMQPHRRVTGNAAPNQYAQDALISGARSFYFKKIKVDVPKKFIYDDADTNLPTNCNMYMAVCVCNVDGTAGGSLTTDQRVQVNADATLYYKDP